MPMPVGLKSTPTTARFADRVSGWEDTFGMAFALDYGDPALEYTALRENVVALEYSVLRKWYIEGPRALETIDAVFSRNMSAAPAGRVLYGVVIDQDGLMIEDVTAVKFTDEQVLVLGGELETEAQLRQAAPAGTTVTDRRGEIAVASIQGPLSRDLLQRLTSADVSNEGLPYYGSTSGAEVAGIPATLLRIGFTAELGYEIMVEWDRAQDLWDAILGQEDLPVEMMGITAILVARTEAGMVMGGYEYDRTISPYECGLGWTVDLDKTQLQGRDALALAKVNASTRLVSLVIDAPAGGLDGARIVADGEEVGKVTMAVRSPALDGRTLALARLHKSYAPVGTSVAVASDGDYFDATVHRTPAFDPERIRVKS